MDRKRESPLFLCSFSGLGLVLRRVRERERERGAKAVDTRDIGVRAAVVAAAAAEVAVVGAGGDSCSLGVMGVSSS